MPIISIPPVVYLEKIKNYTLNTVEVGAKRVPKYFTLRAYLRSWKLVNDKLVRYGDVIVDYQVPFERTNGGFHLGKKNLSARLEISGLMI